MINLRGKNFNKKLFVDGQADSTFLNLNCKDESFKLRAFISAINVDFNETQYVSEESPASNEEEVCVQCKYDYIIIRKYDNN